jgi:hypothetical protein
MPTYLYVQIHSGRHWSGAVPFLYAPGVHSGSRFFRCGDCRDSSWVPEMKTTANFILRKIKEEGSDQYSALLQSIGVAEEPAEEIQASVEAL